MWLVAASIRHHTPPGAGEGWRRVPTNWHWLGTGWFVSRMAFEIRKNSPVSLGHGHLLTVTHITMLELLDRLCRYHHTLKTTKGWALVEGSGKRDFVPPEDPRPPRFGKGPKGSGAGVDGGEGAGGDNAGMGGKSAERAAGASRVSPQVGGTSTLPERPRQSQSQ